MVSIVLREIQPGFLFLPIALAVGILLVCTTPCVSTVEPSEETPFALTYLTRNPIKGVRRGEELKRG